MDVANDSNASKRLMDTILNWKLKNQEEFGSFVTPPGWPNLQDRIHVINMGWNDHYNLESASNSNELSHQRDQGS